LHYKPLIFDIKGNSLEDGPGIRSVIFLKGCSLDCAWCHNPESKNPDAELWWDKEQCIGDGDCMRACPQKAISREFPFFINRDKCQLCFKCVDICPSKALSRIGQSMDIEEIVNKLLPYKPYFTASGGGVTISGGEPGLFPRFVSDLLIRLKKERIHTLVETAGRFNYIKFKDLVLPNIDTLYFDIKFFDSNLYKKYCRISNKEILQNFILLHQISMGGNFELLPRTPLIPGITDTPKNIDDIVTFYKTNGVKKAALLENNPLWFNKFENIGKTNNSFHDEQMRKVYDEKQKSKITEYFIRNGIEIV